MARLNFQYDISSGWNYLGVPFAGETIDLNYWVNTYMPTVTKIIAMQEDGNWGAAIKVLNGVPDVAGEWHGSITTIHTHCGFKAFAASGATPTVDDVEMVVPGALSLTSNWEVGKKVRFIPWVGAEDTAFYTALGSNGPWTPDHPLYYCNKILGNAKAATKLHNDEDGWVGSLVTGVGSGFQKGESYMVVFDDDLSESLLPQNANIFKDYLYTTPGSGGWYKDASHTGIDTDGLPGVQQMWSHYNGYPNEGYPYDAYSAGYEDPEYLTTLTVDQVYLPNGILAPSPGEIIVANYDNAIFGLFEAWDPASLDAGWRACGRTLFDNNHWVEGMGSCTIRGVTPDQGSLGTYFSYPYNNSKLYFFVFDTGSRKIFKAYPYNLNGTPMTQPTYNSNGSDIHVPILVCSASTDTSDIESTY